MICRLSDYLLTKLLQSLTTFHFEALTWFSCLSFGAGKGLYQAAPFYLKFNTHHIKPGDTWRYPWCQLPGLGPRRDASLLVGHLVNSGCYGNREISASERSLAENDIVEGHV